MVQVLTREELRILKELFVKVKRMKLSSHCLILIKNRLIILFRLGIKKPLEPELFQSILDLIPINLRWKCLVIFRW